MDTKNGIEPIQDSIEKSDKKLESAASSFWSASTISSASISSSDDPFDIDEKVTMLNNENVTMPYNAAPSKSSKSLTDDDDDDLPESTLPDNTVQFSPPVQTMERPGESSAPSTYRIPSSVFARTKSKSPEWSVASNESLFSIHMGNMSFSTDHLILMGRSGELGLFKSGELVKPGDLRSGEILKPVNLKSGEIVKPVEATTSSQFMKYTNNQAPVYQTTDIGRRNNVNLKQGVGVSAFETMKEVLKENETDFDGAGKRTKALSATSSSHRPGGGGNSSKTFAFPILTGAGDKSSSRKNGSIKPQFRQESYHPPEPTSQSQTQPAAKPEAAAAQTTSWFSCFSCCPFRS